MGGAPCGALLLLLLLLLTAAFRAAMCCFQAVPVRTVHACICCCKAAGRCLQTCQIACNTFCATGCPSTTKDSLSFATCIVQALQRELDFELDDEELGGDGLGSASLQPRYSRTLEQALQRQLSGGGEAGGHEAPHATATVNGVYRSSTDEAPFLGGKL